MLQRRTEQAKAKNRYNADMTPSRAKDVDLQNANVHLGRSDGDGSSGGLLLSCTGDSKDENFAIYIQNIVLLYEDEFSLPRFLKVVYIEGITD